MLGAVEEFANELAAVARRLMRTSGWSQVREIVVGGGMRATRIANWRSAEPRKASGGRSGSVAHLVAAPIPAGRDSLFAVNIGGTNMLVGLVELNLKQAPDMSAARVMKLEIWRHKNEEPTREEALAHMCAMIGSLIRRAEADKLRPAPSIGIGCPGLILEDGRIERRAQNLPGNWTDAGFNLPQRINEVLPGIDGQTAIVMMHNGNASFATRDMQSRPRDAATHFV